MLERVLSQMILVLSQADDLKGSPNDNALPDGNPLADWLSGHQAELVITGIVVLSAFIVSTLVARRLVRGISDEVRRHKTRRAIGLFAQLAALAVILVMWASRLDWQLWIGLASVGLALALQNVILSVAGWVYITLRRPYDIGDRIQSGQIIGDVIDIRMLHTYLLEVGHWVDADQSTGRVIYLPNSQVFTGPLQNYTQGFPYIWHELPVMITFESDWRRAKEIVEGLVSESTHDISGQVAAFIRRMKRDYPIRYEHLSPIVYTRVRDSGVELTIRYLTRVRQRRPSHSELCERILDAFADEPAIDFAYPTYRMFKEAGGGEPLGGAGLAPLSNGESAKQ
jgi:small-conductance mechanosensitive channel